MNRDDFEAVMSNSGYTRRKPELYIKNYEGEYANPVIEKAYRYWLKSNYSQQARAASKNEVKDDRMGINDEVKPELLNKRFRDWG